MASAALFPSIYFSRWRRLVARERTHLLAQLVGGGWGGREGGWDLKKKAKQKERDVVASIATLAPAASAKRRVAFKWCSRQKQQYTQHYRDTHAHSRPHTYTQMYIRGRGSEVSGREELRSYQQLLSQQKKIRVRKKKKKKKKQPLDERRQRNDSASRRE